MGRTMPPVRPILLSWKVSAQSLRTSAACAGPLIELAERYRWHESYPLLGKMGEGCDLRDANVEMAATRCDRKMPSSASAYARGSERSRPAVRLWRCHTTDPSDRILRSLPDLNSSPRIKQKRAHKWA